jgi:hypothetical protein
MRFPRFLFSSRLLLGGVETVPGGVLPADSPRNAVGIGEIDSDLRLFPAPIGCDPELERLFRERLECDPDLKRLFKERRVVLDRLLAQRKPELIQQGIEAYLRDLPRLLAENRYLQRVAYRGNERVAIAPTSRKLWKRLEKLGLTDRGEIFEVVVEPLDIDEGDEIPSEGPSSGLSQP